MNIQTRRFAEYAVCRGVVTAENIKELYTDLQEEAQCDDNQFFRELMAIGFQNIDLDAVICELC